ncbi:MAG: radical SAM family heme chaperone HemW [Parvularculaceae bacterium]
MRANEPPDADIAVYVHWPFCARICPYCDFNVHKDRRLDAARWTAALVRELSHWAALTPGRRVASLYFGGGTPSLAPPAVIGGVIEAAERLWGFADDPEITLEANPSDAGADAGTARLESFRASGVNRLSLGVQSFDDAALKFLGRDHDGADARGAIDAALSLFPRASADFIYGLPGQTADQWADELRAALATGLGHLSLYQLTVEPGTAFDRQVAKGRWAAPGDALSADLFDLAQEMTAAAGIPAYEISNHARAGDRSRHNSAYWRGGDYVGVGPGAHGRVTLGAARHATETARAPAGYLTRVEAAGHALILDDPLTEEEARVEKFAMGLRTVDGVSLNAGDLAALSGKIAPLVEDGALVQNGHHLAATADGRRVLNAVLARLLA